MEMELHRETNYIALRNSSTVVEPAQAISGRKEPREVTGSLRKLCFNLSAEFPLKYPQKSECAENGPFTHLKLKDRLGWRIFPRDGFGSTYTGWKPHRKNSRKYMINNMTDTFDDTMEVILKADLQTAHNSKSWKITQPELRRHVSSLVMLVGTKAKRVRRRQNVHSVHFNHSIYQGHILSVICKHGNQVHQLYA